MAQDGNILYGPESMAYALTSAVSPAPGNNGSGGQIAQRYVYPLGTQLVLQDGRKFRFAAAGGAALVPGNVITAAAIVSTDINLTAAAAAADDRTVTFTHGAATVVINYFAEGFLVVSVTPGGGDTYKIASHAALTSSGADTVNLAPGQRVRRALTTTSRLDLMAHPYFGAIQAAATTLTGAPIGVAISAIAVTSGSGWLQTRGTCGVLGAGTLVVGANAVSPTGTAGATGPSAASTSVNIGMVQSLAASTAWSSIYLLIDG